jgi:MinD superfamily P-loop ATPase
MKEIAVISGKGGTGKTSLVASFAALAEQAVVADCDVDAPDLALVLEPRIERTVSFVGGKVARRDAARCVGCGRCVEACRFEAAASEGPGNGVADRTCVIDPRACEGCGVCAAICPSEACTLEPVVDGEWFISRTRHGPLVHARLRFGGENSGKLVSCVRKEARALAESESLELLICDGPPGIGCPVIASVSGVDLVLIVVEPTVSALHDFERVVELTSHFGIRAAACVNKFDLNEALTERIEERANDLGVAMAGRIPYDEVVVGAQLYQKSVVEYSADGVSVAIRGVWRRVAAWLDSSEGRDEPSGTVN